MAEPLVAGEPAKHRRLELLDVLRFAAALLVVGYHWLFNGIDNGKVLSLDFTVVAPLFVYGSFGVHLFFLISGFVISQSARGKSAGAFVVSRGVRLFPAYWVAMLCTTIVVTVWANADLKVTPLQFLANLTMAPSLFGQSPVDGVYWTLMLELSFYAAVFLVLLCGWGRYLDRIFPIWGMAMLIIAVGAPSIAHLPYLGGYYAFFAAGAVMATIQQRGFSAYRVAGLLASIAVAIEFVVRSLESFNAVRAFDSELIPTIALVLSFFALVALLWIPRVAHARIPLSRPISDLTYPVYLLHAHIGYTVLNRLATNDNVWLVYAGMLITLAAASLAMHWIVEVRLRDVWFKAFSLLRHPVDALQSRITRRPALNRA